MPPAAAGAITGVFVAVILAVIFVEGGASGALLVPLFALLLTPVGALLGWALGRAVRALRKSSPTS